MKFDFNSQSKNILKFSILIIVYLVFFYFLIFKNMLNLFELKEQINSNGIKKQALVIENIELEKSLETKRKSYEEKISYFDNMNKKQDSKLIFPKIADALNNINMYMLKNNIYFESLGRIQKNGDTVNVSLAFSGNEKDTINFIKELENAEFYFSLNENSFKIGLSDKKLLTKMNVKFKVENSYEKMYIDDNKNFSLFNSSENIENSNSYMRIGNNIFYKKNIQDKQEQNKQSGGDKK